MKYRKSLGAVSAVIVLGISATVLVSKESGQANQVSTTSTANRSAISKTVEPPKVRNNIKSVVSLSREEAIVKAEIELRAKSGFEKRAQERNLRSEVKLNAVQKIVSHSAGQNAAIQQYLNVDTKKTFGIDYDAKMQEAQRNRSTQDTVTLEQNLLSQGASQHQVDAVKKFRQQVLNISNNSAE